MSVVTMNFNKTDLSELIEIHDVRRNIGNNRSIATSYTSAVGVNVQQQTIDAKFIEVEFSIWSKDRNTLKHKLAGIFNVSSAKKLVFSDEPDKYYLAMPIESISMQETSGRRSTGSMRFIVPDGVAHSSAYKSVTEPISATDRLVFEVNNEGNVDAYPIITIKNNSENGYVGIVNASGALEVGDREEADIGTVKRSEVLIDFRDDRISNGFERATKNKAVTNDNGENVIGTSEVVTVWNEKHIRLRNQATQGKYGNYATSLSWDIPVDSAGEVGSLNDHLIGKINFTTNSINQYGFIKVTISDTNGQFLYGFECFKQKQGQDCQFNALRSDGKGSYYFLKRWNFICTSDSKQNPFTSSNGRFELSRNDDKVHIYYNGSYHSFTVPEIKDRKSAKIHVMLGSYYDKPQPEHMYLDELMYRKDFVPTIGDVPNRYPIGSTIIVNNEEDTIMVDGMNKFGDRVHGSSWIKLPPGKSQLEIYTSSWVQKKPTVSINFEERWL
jgi:putative phage tail component, N-terminal domain protein